MSLILLDFPAPWSVTNPMNGDQKDTDARELEPAHVRYIKLGVGGCNEEECLSEGFLRIDFAHISHAASRAKDLERMKEEAGKFRRDRQSVTRDVDQVRDFYELGEDCLWITFARGRLHWCFADQMVAWHGRTDGDNGHRTRSCLNGWHDQDLTGKALLKSDLSGQLTATAGTRNTICRVRAQDYLLRRLNGVDLPDVVRAKDHRKALIHDIINLARLLDPQDFELLVELVFASSGWRRTSAIGGSQKTIDLEMVLPTTQERAFVQVKSKTSRGEFEKYLKAFRERPETRMFYVWHSGPEDFTASDFGCTLVGPKRLAELILDVGLFDWLISRAR